MVENRFKFLGVKSWLCGRKCYVRHRGICRKCAVCGWPRLWKNVPPALSRPGQLPRPQKAFNSLDFQAASIFQAFLHAEMPLLSSSCACDSNHVTMNTRAFCSIYHLQFSNNRKCKFLFSPLSDVKRVCRFV
jgi:hypothetical protein